MSKRGSVELILFVAVAVVALGGIFFFLRDSNTGMIYNAPVYRPGEVRTDMLVCQSECTGRPIDEPMYSWGIPLTGEALQNCWAKCQQEEGIAPDEYAPGAPTGQFYIPEVAELESGNAITGHFVIPGAKAYGGEVRGVSAPGTRAFPAGRAYELPDQSCFECSCLVQGITAVDRAAAEQVCMNNCGGQVTDVKVGNCE